MSQPLTRLLTSHPCEFPTPATSYPTPATKLRLELWEKTREFGFVFQDTATTTAARASVTPGSLDLTAHAIRRTWPTASRSLSIAQTPSPTWSATTGGNANAATAFASERYIGEKERFQPWQFSCLSDFAAKVFLVEKFCVWIVILLFFFKSTTWQENRREVLRVRQHYLWSCGWQDMQQWVRCSEIFSSRFVEGAASVYT